MFWSGDTNIQLGFSSKYSQTNLPTSVSPCRCGSCCKQTSTGIRNICAISTQSVPHWDWYKTGANRAEFRQAYMYIYIPFSHTQVPIKLNVITIARYVRVLRGVLLTLSRWIQGCKEKFAKMHNLRAAAPVQWGRDTVCKYEGKYLPDCISYKRAPLCV